MRPALGNWLAAALSLTLTWIVLELLLVPLLLPLTPLRIHAGLPRALRPLAQSSKAATLPASGWIALLGDSYAQGAGDWLFEVDPRGNPPYHSAHLLHARSGRDVVSFGASGAGSLRAMGTEPETFLAYLSRTWRFAVPDPGVLLVYFYEGNDLQDNLRDLDHTFAPPYEAARLRDPEYFRRFVQQTAPLRTPLAEELETWHWSDNFFLARFVLRVLGALVRGGWDAAAPAPDPSPGGVSRALIAGRLVALPDGLQAPALELSPEELDLALYAHEQAFALLRQRFPATRTLVVYLPSPLAAYALRSPEVSAQVFRPEEGVRSFPTPWLAARSDEICERIARITRAAGAEFLDARPRLWSAAQRAPIHGPRDWKHFNRSGQELLVDDIAGVLAREPDTESACASLRDYLAH